MTITRNNPATWATPPRHIHSGWWFTVTLPEYDETASTAALGRAFAATVRAAVTRPGRVDFDDPESEYWDLDDRLICALDALDALDETTATQGHIEDLIDDVYDWADEARVWMHR